MQTWCFHTPILLCPHLTPLQTLNTAMAASQGEGFTVAQDPAWLRPRHFLNYASSSSFCASHIGFFSPSQKQSANFYYLFYDSVPFP